jgi:hypothetical protein
VLKIRVPWSIRVLPIVRDYNAATTLRSAPTLEVATTSEFVNLFDLRLFSCAK